MRTNFWRQLLAAMSSARRKEKPRFVAPRVESLEERVTPANPVALSINRTSPTSSSTTSTNVAYTITFDQPVTGVDAGDFKVFTSSVLQAGAPTVTGSGSTYAVTIPDLRGTGDLRLDLIDDDSIVSTGGPLGGAGPRNGSFQGQTYSITLNSAFVAPSVQSIVRSSPTQQSTDSATVAFIVTFSEPVTGVDLGDFQLALTGSAAGTKSSVTALDSSNYLVTVTGVGGVGQLGLNLIDNGSIRDTSGNALVNGFTGFSSQTALSVLSNPTYLTSADVNRDGALDLITVNAGSINLLTGNGNGTFKAPASIATPIQGDHGVVADVNGDGNVDFVTFYRNTSGISVLLGNGNGTFQTGITTAATSVQSVAFGDLNSDGKPDLVYNRNSGTSIFVKLGNGNGTFGPDVTYTGTANCGVAIADFNGDQRLDIVVGGSTTRIYLGAGDGTFANPVTWAGGSSSDPAIGDVNNDGKLDLVFSDGNNQIRVGVGNGDGTFRAATTYGIGSGGLDAPGLADFNLDGKLDVMAANNFSNSASILIGNGDGTFKTQVTFAMGSASRTGMVGDLNGDGRPDFATANNYDRKIGIRFNLDGSFTGQTYALTGDVTAPTLAIAPDATTGASQITFTFTFSENVTGFTASDVAVANGVKGAFTAVSGSSYTLVVTPTAGTLTVAVPTNAAFDAASNGNVAASATVSATKVYNWTQTLSGTYLWNDPANWNNGAGGFPNVVDDVANLTADIVGNVVITVNGAYVIGRLNVGDASGSSAYTLASGGLGTGLTFDVSSGAAVLAKTNAGGSDSIAAPITLADNLTLDNATAGSFVVGGGVAGSGSIEKTGSGTIVLNGNNRYSGATNVNAGTLSTGTPSANLNLSNVSGGLNIANATNVKASSYYTPDDRAPWHASDWSGMTGTFPTGTASTSPGNTMWLSNGTTGSGTWIAWDLGAVYDNVTGTHVWNYNESGGGYIGRGVKQFDLQIATTTPTDFGGSGTWTTIGTVNWSDTTQYRGTGAATYSGFDYDWPSAFSARYIRFNNTQNYGTPDNYTGLSEVVFKTQANGIPDSSPVTVAANATLSLTNNETIGSLAGAGAVTNSTSGAVTLTLGADNTSPTYTGSIRNGAGTLGVVKAGFGTQTLSGTNTFTGASSVNTGVLKSSPSFTSANYALFALNTSFSFSLSTIAFPAASYSVAGSLPSGVSLSSAGVLSGTPTSTGTYPVTFVADNGISAAATQSFTLTNAAPPKVLSLTRTSSATVTAATSVQFTATFDQPVTGVDASDFRVVTSAVMTAGAPTVSGSGSTYTITVSGIRGTGDLRLDLIDDDSIVGGGVPLGAGTNGSFQGQTYSVRLNPSFVAPTVQSIVRSSPTAQFMTAGTLVFSVAFSEPVSGVDLGDFQLALTGTATGTLSSISAQNSSTYLVTVTGAGGLGQVGLNLVDNGTIRDTDGNALANGFAGFSNLTTLTVGNGPTRVHAADFNGDGKLDLVATNSGSQCVGVMIGNGDGTFKAQVTYATPAKPEGTVVADVNGDGKADILPFDRYTNHVAVLLSNGDGTFKAAITTPASQPVYMAVADVNNDGKADLVIDRFTTNAISVKLGNGDGTFGAETTFAGNANSGVAVADVNDDQRPDIVVAGSSTIVLLGNGDGSFLSPTTLANAASTEVSIGDVNNDGKLDLVFANNNNSRISVSLGNGNGSFKPISTYAVASVPFTAVLADFNLDGNLDVLAANNNSNSASVLLGNGDGAFKPQVSYAMGRASRGGIAADLNGDGRADFATANTYDGTVTLRLGLDGGFTGQTYFEDPVQPTAAPKVLSLDRTAPAGSAASATSQTFTAVFSEPVTGVDISDFQVAVTGTLSASISNVSAIDGSNYDVTVSSISGSGTLTVKLVDDGTIRDVDNRRLVSAIPAFAAQATFAANAAPRSIATGDLNGDGIPDLVVATNSTQALGVRFGNGNGTFQTETLLALGRTPQNVKLADVNGDGLRDLIVSTYSSSGVSVFLSNGNGTFKTRIDTTAGSPYTFALGDINGDGKLDVALSQGGNAAILLGNGDGTFLIKPAASLGISGRVVGLADFNGDGKTDLVSVGGSPTCISVIFGNGDGSFKPTASTFAAAAQVNNGVVADLDGDGKIDVVTSSFYSIVTVLLGNGNGTFKPQVTYSTNSGGVRSLSVSDVNGDGRLDVFVPSSYNSRVTVLVGNGDGTFLAPVSFAVDSAPYEAVAADFNSDGRIDIATANSNGNKSVSLLLSNGGNFTGQAGAVDQTNPTASITSQPTTVSSTSSATFTYTGNDPTVGGVSSGINRFETSLDGSTFTTAASPANFTSLGDGSHTFQVRAVDNAGNVGPAASYIWTVEAAAPTLVITPNGTAMTIATVTFTFTFSENVTGFTAGDVLAINGTKGTFTQLSGSTYTLVVTPIGSGAVTVSVAANAAQDGAGKASGFASATVANDRPTVTITRTSPSTILGLGGATFTVTFSEAVTGVDAGDFTPVKTGSVSFGSPVVVSAQSASVYLVTVPVASGSGTAGLNLTDDGSIRDLSGNRLAGTNASISFAPVQTYATNITNSITVVAPDVNNDGNPDLVVNSNNSALLSVRTGNGNGTFSSSALVDTSVATWVIEFGDVDGDGNSDLVMLDSIATRGAVALGNGNGTFKPRQTFLPITQPGSVAIADFNGDGKADLFTATSIQLNIPVGFLAGNGNGTFAAVQTFDGGRQANDIAVADVNGDGLLDVVVPNVIDSTLSILLGNGNGTFKPRTTVGTMSTPQNIAAGDYNGDGKVDLAVSHNFTLSVFLGNGNATFGAATTYSITSNARTIKNADFNGDGRLDLAVCNAGVSSLDVLMGNGDGTFKPRQTIAISSASNMLVVADFNRDGYPDVATSPSASSPGINVLLANGNGNVTGPTYSIDGANPTVTITSGPTTTSGAAGTFGASGSDPLVDSVSSGVNHFEYAFDGGSLVSSVSAAAIAFSGFADGSHVFQIRAVDNVGNVGAFVSRSWTVDLTPPTVQVSGSALTAATATLTLTGTDPTSSGVGSGVSRYEYSLDSGPFRVTDSPLTLFGLSNGSHSIAARAVDAIGNVGSATTFSWTVDAIRPVLQSIVRSIASTAIAGGDATFVVTFSEAVTGVDAADFVVTKTGSVAATSTPVVAALDDRTFAVTVNNVSGNGSVGLNLIDDNSIRDAVDNRLGSASGSTGAVAFAAPTTTASSATVSTVLAADMNNDGLVDLVTGGATTLTVFLSNGNGTFKPRLTTASGVQSLAIADFNGDGKLDVLAAPLVGVSARIHLGNGNGTFKPITSIGLLSGAVGIDTVAGDFDGDGKPDMAFVANDGAINGVMLSNGDGTFKPRQTFSLGTVGTVVHRLAAADFNGDGALDLVVTTGDCVSVLLGNRDGSFKPLTTFGTRAGAYGVDVADLNGDGKLDLAVSNFFTSDSSVSILLGNGNGEFQPQATFAAPGTPHDLTIVDVDGDGKLDVVTASFGVARVNVLVGNGDGSFKSVQTFSTTSTLSNGLAAADFNGDQKIDLAVAASTVVNVLSAGAIGGSTGPTYVVDQIAPTLAITPNGTATNAATITFTFTFGESVTGFDASDVTVSNGTKGTFTALSGSTYTLDVTPGVDGTVTASAALNAAQDAAGNASGAASATVTSDRTAPTLTITPSGTTTVASTITFDFTFNEIVTGFDASDVTVTNGVKGAFTAVSGSTYTLVVTTSAGGGVTVDVGTNSAQDSTGNGNTPASATVTTPAIYNWTRTAGGTYQWNDPANWNNGAGGFPNGVDAIANVTANIAGDVVITVNGAFTVGQVNLGDASGTSVYALASGGAGTGLTFDVSSGAARLAKTNAGGSDSIAAAIALADDLTLDNATVVSLTVSGNVGGAGSLEKIGSGTIVLSGANSYSGATTISAGTLAAGTSPANLNLSGVSGGLNIANGTYVKASSYYPNDDRAPWHASDWSGVTGTFPSGTASTNPGGTAWLSNNTTGVGTWIAWDLGSTYNVSGAHVWNYNEAGGFIGRGIKQFDLQIATTAPTEFGGSGGWTTIGTVDWSNTSLYRGTGATSYAGFDYAWASVSSARYVRFNNVQNYGTSDNYTGLSEIVFRTLGAGGIPDASPVTVAASATLNLTASEAIGSLAGAGTVTASAAPVTLTLGANNGSRTFTGSMQNGSGTLGVVKVGAGTQTLSGTNTLTGATSVSAGVLQMSPSFTSASSATFYSQVGSHSFSVSSIAFPAAAYSAVGTLPSGVTLSPAGLLSGTPTNVGSYPVTFVANNGIGAAATQSFTLTVLPSSPPTVPVDSNGGTNTVVEGAATGTTVGITASATATPTAGPVITYSLSNDAAGRFQINATTGVVTVSNGSLIDFDSATSHSITVVATDPVGATSSATFVVNVTNGAPGAVTDANAQANTIFTSSATGVSVGITAVATDPGGGPVTYSLSNNANGAFQIDPTSGVVTVADPSKIASPGNFSITVVAKDASSLTSSASFTVKAATPITLAPPNLLMTGGSSLLEYSPTGTLLASWPIPSNDSPRGLVPDLYGMVYVYNGTFSPILSAYDVAANVWTSQTMAEWSTVNNGSYANVASYGDWVFAPDMSTGSGGGARGIVRFEKAGGAPVRFATGSDYTKVCLGFDGFLYGLSGSSVHVYRPDTMAFVRSIGLPGGRDYRDFAVNAAGQIFACTWDSNVYKFDGNGVQLATVSVTGLGDTFTDMDLSSAGQLALTTRFAKVVLMTDSFTNITTFQSSGTFIAFAEPAQIPVTVGGPAITSNGGGPTAAVSVPENTTAVTTVAATAAGQITYSIAGGADAAKFTINSATGTLAFLVAPDFEATTDVGSNGVYDVVVRASDGASYDSQAIAVTVTNVNERLAINSNGGGDTAAISVPENTTAVTTVTALQDSPPVPLTFSIVGGADAGKFVVNASTGALSFASAPYFEFPTDAGSNNVYEVIVQVTDGNLVDIQAIAVTVTDVVATQVTLSAYGSYVASGVSSTITVSMRGAGGVLAGYTGTVRFASNDPSAVLPQNYAFTPSDGGVHTFTFSLATAGTRTLTVTDVANPTLTATASIFVTSGPPTVPVDSNGGTNTVIEGAATGTTVGITASASATPAGPPIAYSLSNDAAGRFQINASTGVVSVANGALIDFDSATSHSITVVATDPVGATSSAAFVVNVTNGPPGAIADANAQTNTVLTSASAGVTVGITAAATDPGGGPVTYSLSNNANGAFQINPTTGVVTVADPSKIASPGNLSIAVVAKDSSNATSSASFTVTAATPITLAPPNLLMTGGSSLLEYSPTGTLLASWPIPSNDSPRGLVPDLYGMVYVYNGTFSPILSAYDVTANRWTSQTMAEWSTVNNGSYANVASYGDWVFATDMSTGSGGPAKGIVRFEKSGAPPVRFATGSEYTKVCLGFDGLLYGLSGSGVHVYRPDTMALVRTIALPGGRDYRDFAVNAAGQIFACTWDTNVYKFDGNGVQLASVSVAQAGDTFSDMDLSGGGQLALVTRFGKVVLMSDLFTNITTFQSSGSFIAFAEPAQIPVTVSGPVITSNGGGPTASVAVPEDSSAVTTVTALQGSPPGPLTFSIIGGADAAKFVLNASTGALSFASAPDFESPTDAGANNVYDVIVRVTDGALADSQAIAVTVTDVVPLAITPNGTTTNGATITFTFTFGENVTGFDASDVTVTNGGKGTFSALSGSTYTLVVAPAVDGTVTASAALNAAQNAAGSSNAAAIAAVTSDRTAPTASIASHPPAITPSGSATFTVTGDDPIVGGVASGVSRLEYALDSANFATVVGAVNFTSLAIGMHTFQVRAVDNAGNTGAPTSYSWTIDPNLRVIAIVRTTPAGPFVNATSVTYTVTFNDSVTGLDSGDFVVTRTGTVDSAAPSFVALSGDTYLVTVSLVTGDGTLRLDVVDDDSILSNATGLPLGGVGIGNGAFQGEVYSIDHTGPTTTIVGSPAVMTGGSATFDFTASDSAGVNHVEYRLDNAGPFVAAVAPLTLHGLSDGSHSIQIRAVDSLGNVGDAASFAWVVDLQAPTVASIVRAVPAAALTRASSLTYTVTFGEAVTGVDAGDFFLATANGQSVAIGTVTAISQAIYRVDATGVSGSGLLALGVRSNGTIRDLVGNVYAAADFTGQSYAIDQTAPTATIVSRPPARANSTSASFDFTGSDPSVNGVASGVDRLEYSLDGGDFVADTSASFYGLASGSHVFLVRAIDNVGNVGPAASYSWTIDLVAPLVISLERASVSPTTAASVTYAVTFDEPVVNVDAADFRVFTTGTVTSSSLQVTGSGATYLVVVGGIAGAGSLRVDLLDNGTITDLAGNHLANTALPVSFELSQTFAAIPGASGVTTADLNGDGALDVIETNGGNVVSVLIGDGDGGLGTPQTFAVGNVPVAVVVADVDGNGKPDLVVVDRSGAGISVLLGNGNGSFATQQTFGTGARPTAAALADLNGDGKADVVVVNAASNFATVLLGNGNGSFQPSKTFATGATPVALALGDVNGDGKLDLVAVNQFSRSISVLLGNGNGTFKPQQTSSIGALPAALALADVNGDGKLDVVVANSGDNAIGVLLGNGNGTFAAMHTYAVGSLPRSLAVADVSGDAIPDVVVANNGNVSVLRGLGDGTFLPQQTFAGGANAASITVGDVNGDGASDVLIASDSAVAGVLLGNPAGNAGGQSYVIGSSAPDNSHAAPNLTPTVTGVGAASAQVLAVVPFVGPTSGGTMVVISGINFLGVTSVRFGGADAASYTVNSASQITAVAPAGRSGLVDVTVTNIAGTSSTASPLDDYTYAAPEVVSVVVNGGPIAARDRFGKAPNLASQNSVVAQILVTFNQRVTLDPGAFSIISLAAALSATGATSSSANVSVIATGVPDSGDATTGYVQYLLTFAPGAGVNSFDNSTRGGTAFTTLKDGSWQLLTAGSLIHAGADTASDRADVLWSLFGAANEGDVRGPNIPGAAPDTVLVDGLALNDVYSAFGSRNDGSSAHYNAGYDWNLDGYVDGIDLNRVYANFGAIWKF